MADGRKKGAGENVDKGPGSKSGAKSEGSVKSHAAGDAGAEATEKSHDVEFAEGGDTKMFGEQAAGSQKPGGTAHDVSGGAPGAEFAKGGTNKMFGFEGSKSATAGITSAR
jgi:hypothetical protein